MQSQLDYLDKVAFQVARDEFKAYGPLSSGERAYVALAASRSDLLQDDGYTIVQAMDRIGPEWLDELNCRWKRISRHQLKA